MQLLFQPGRLAACEHPTPSASPCRMSLLQARCMHADSSLLPGSCASESRMASTLRWRLRCAEFLALVWGVGQAPMQHKVSMLGYSLHVTAA